MNAKLWSLVLLLVLAAITAACGSAPTPETVTVVETVVVKEEVEVAVEGTPQIVEKEVVVTATPEPEGPAKTQLVYMTHSHEPANRVNAQLIEEFEALHPEVEIVYDNAPHANFEQKILTAFAGGSGPDVFWAGLARPPG